MPKENRLISNLHREIMEAKSAIEVHTRNIGFQTLTINKTTALLHRSETLLQYAKERLEIAERLLSEQNS